MTMQELDVRRKAVSALLAQGFSPTDIVKAFARPVSRTTVYNVKREKGSRKRCPWCTEATTPRKGKTKRANQKAANR